MAAFRVLLERRAQKTFAKLKPNVRKRFYAVFEELEADPYRPRPGCDIRILKGHPDVRAVRVGQYRAIYEIDRPAVRVTLIGHRRNVYGR